MPNREGPHCGCGSDRSCDPKRHCAAAVGIDGSARLPGPPLLAVFGQTQPSEVRASGRGILYLVSWLISSR